MPELTDREFCKSQTDSFSALLKYDKFSNYNKNIITILLLRNSSTFIQYNQFLHEKSTKWRWRTFCGVQLHGFSRWLSESAIYCNMSSALYHLIQSSAGVELLSATSPWVGISWITNCTATRWILNMVQWNVKWYFLNPAPFFIRNIKGSKNQ